MDHQLDLNAYFYYTRSHPIQSCLVVLIIYVVSQLIYLSLLHPLASYPGPFSAKFSNLWKAIHCWKGDYITTLSALHAKHDVIRIGFNEISIIAPEEIKLVYGHKSEFLKGPFYNNWGVGGRTSHFSNRDPVTHAASRRRVAGAYSLSTLLTLEEFCDESTFNFLALLAKDAASGKEVDIAHYIDYYTMDTLGEIAFGKNFGLLKAGNDESGFVSKLGGATILVASIACLNENGWIIDNRFVLPILKSLFGIEGPAVIVEHATRLVQSRWDARLADPEGHELRQDMLYRIMAARTTSGLPVTFKEVLSEALTLLVAGSDTTATSLRAAIGYVYTNPATLLKSRQEIFAALESGTISFPISYADSTKLVFVQACMKESMRLHPAVGMPMQRVVPSGGREVGGKFYPAGTLIGMSAWDTHGDSRAYGVDAKLWRPERWIEAEDKNDLESFNMTFGAGARICLGKSISLMEMSKLLPTLFHNFDVHFKNVSKPYRTQESWFAVQEKGYCTISKREEE